VSARKREARVESTVDVEGGGGGGGLGGKGLKRLLLVFAVHAEKAGHR
jgi:hypothetical protein